MRICQQRTLSSRPEVVTGRSKGVIDWFRVRARGMAGVALGATWRAAEPRSRAHDTTPPAASARIRSDELRSQFTGLKAEIDAKLDDGAPTVLIRAVASANTNSLQALSQSISNPPTQAQMQALQAKVNELIAALKTPES